MNEKIPYKDVSDDTRKRYKVLKPFWDNELETLAKTRTG
jgi:hypothetical protein